MESRLIGFNLDTYLGRPATPIKHSSVHLRSLTGTQLPGWNAESAQNWALSVSGAGYERMTSFNETTSTLTPGPIVVETAIPFTYVPLLVEGLIRTIVSKNAVMF